MHPQTFAMVKQMDLFGKNHLSDVLLSNILGVGTEIG